MKILLLALIMFFYPYCFAVNNTPQFSLGYNCIKGSELQLARSRELQTLVNADQTDREHWQNTEAEMIKIAHKDLVRRKRVGEIFGEGCLQDPKDYLAAALIYQHGDTSDHFYQAFVWSKRAAELGDLNGQSFSALAIDRYLLSVGKKQLFGSQFQKMLSGRCYCMQPVELSIPDTFRKEYSGHSLDEKYQKMASMNEAGCPSLECPTVLQPTPKGSIIGLW